MLLRCACGQLISARQQRLNNGMCDACYSDARRTEEARLRGRGKRKRKPKR